MEPSELEPQYDPQFDAPKDEEINPFGGEEVDLGMDQHEQPPVKRSGLPQRLND